MAQGTSDLQENRNSDMLYHPTTLHKGPPPKGGTAANTYVVVTHKEDLVHSAPRRAHHTDENGSKRRCVEHHMHGAPQSHGTPPTETKQTP